MIEKNENPITISEMRSRISRANDLVSSKVHISTFHSLGIKIVNENSSLMGFNKQPTVATVNKIINVIKVKKIIKNLNILFVKLIFLILGYHIK